MNNFTFILRESKRNYNAETLLQDEITKFVNKVNKSLPTIVKDVIYLTKKYELMDKAGIEEIRQSSKGSLKHLAEKYNIPENELDNLWKMLKGLRNNIYLLPQYMSSVEREMVEKGKLTMDDLSIDLESSAGRSAAAKMYMPMIYKIVNQFVGKSNLSKAELISAATEGFTLAMNDWNRESGTPFKTYAGTRVRQMILNEINSNGHTLSGYNDYAFKQGYTADAISIDSMVNGDDEETHMDRLAALGSHDDEYNEISDKELNIIYKSLEAKFPQRDCVIFYRFFGLNGYQKVKSKDLAKEFGWSEGNIRNSVINKIIKFLRSDKKTQEILSHLHESYNISIMINMMGMDRSYIIESLCNDDMFILLEELNKWNDKETFEVVLNQALSGLDKKDSLYILNVLKEDFDFLDGSFKKHKKIIILFLNMMHPTESMSRKSDVSLLEYMMDIQETYQKYFKR